jgi:hypothetical protein
MEENPPCLESDVDQFKIPVPDENHPVGGRQQILGHKLEWVKYQNNDLERICIDQVEDNEQSNGCVDELKGFFEENPFISSCIRRKETNLHQDDEYAEIKIQLKETEARRFADEDLVGDSQQIIINYPSRQTGESSLQPFDIKTFLEKNVDCRQRLKEMYYQFKVDQRMVQNKYHIVSY